MPYNICRRQSNGEISKKHEGLDIRRRQDISCSYQVYTLSDVRPPEGCWLISFLRYLCRGNTPQYGGGYGAGGYVVPGGYAAARK